MEKFVTMGEIIGSVRTLTKEDLIPYGLSEDVLDRPNMKIVEADLHLINKTFSPQVFGSLKDKKSFIISEEATKDALPSLPGTPVHVTDDLDKHMNLDKDGEKEYKSIGTYLAGRIVKEGGVKIMRTIAALWDKDFPKIVKRISDEKKDLGQSLEIIPSEVGLGDVVDIKKFKYKGGAILKKALAAFPQTSILYAKKGGGTDDLLEEISGCSFIDGIEVDSTELNGAKWTTVFVNSLKDSSFALVKRPVENKAEDRALPYKDKNGKVDLPHLRNALARLSQVKGFSQDEITAAKKKLESVLKTTKKVKGGIHAMSLKESFCTECQSKVDLLIQAEKPGIEAPIITAKDEIIAAKDTEMETLKAKVIEIQGSLDTVTGERDTLKAEKAEGEIDAQAAVEYEAIKANYPEDKKDEIMASIKRVLKNEANKDDILLFAKAHKPVETENNKSVMKSTLFGGASQAVNTDQITPKGREELIKLTGINVKA